MKPVRPSCPLLLLFASALVSACSEPQDPAPSAFASALPETAQVPAVQSTPIEAPVPSGSVASAADIPARFRAIGTEPFWSVQIGDGTLTYSTPELADGITVPATRRSTGAAVIYSATIDGKPLELEVTAQRCSDGMSDAVYPLAVIRRIGPDIQRGCAR